MATAAKQNGVVNIKGRDYVTVAARVQRFREEHRDFAPEQAAGRGMGTGYSFHRATVAASAAAGS